MVTGFNPYSSISGLYRSLMTFITQKPQKINLRLFDFCRLVVFVISPLIMQRREKASFYAENKVGATIGMPLMLAAFPYPSFLFNITPNTPVVVFVPA